MNGLDTNQHYIVSNGQYVSSGQLYSNVPSGQPFSNGSPGQVYSSSSNVQYQSPNGSPMRSVVAPNGQYTVSNGNHNASNAMYQPAQDPYVPGGAYVNTTFVGQVSGGKSGYG